MSRMLNAAQQAKVTRILDLQHFDSADEVIDEALERLYADEQRRHLRSITAASESEITKGEVFQLTPEVLERIEADAREMVRNGIEPDSDVCP